MVFQDPYSSLNPRMNLLQNVGEPLLVNEIAKGQELEDRVSELLRVVGLRPEYLNRYPHAFSGGQRQRIGVARALALNPQLIVLDEPVSALDVSVQAQILNLLQDLQEEFDLTYLFIAHDLSVVEHISDRVAVMYVGMLVESARTELLYRNPLHPYTEALLSSVPKPDPRDRAEPIVLEGDVADPADPPSGCYFHPRCLYNDNDRCVEETPELREMEQGHFVRCHYAGELELTGVGLAGPLSFARASETTGQPTAYKRRRCRTPPGVRSFEVPRHHEMSTIIELKELGLLADSPEESIVEGDGIGRRPKVMLLFPPNWTPTMPHLALPTLAAYMRQNGVDVIQRDLT